MKNIQTARWRDYESKVYNILHILILLLSVFLIITISIDTFRNISFLNQGYYKKIQLWICTFFILDFLLEFVLSGHKWKYLRSRFVFFLVSIPYMNIFSYLNVDFSPETYYFLRFIPLVRKWICLGYRRRLALIQQNIESFYIVCNHASGNRLFFKPYILCSGTYGQSDGYPIHRCPLVGFHGRNDGRLQHLRRYRHREDTFGCSGSTGHDDVSDFHGLCYQSGTANNPAQTAIKTYQKFRFKSKENPFERILLTFASCYRESSDYLHRISAKHR